MESGMHAERRMEDCSHSSSLRSSRNSAGNPLEMSAPNLVDTSHCATI
jgi:hypothetical protein